MFSCQAVATSLVVGGLSQLGNPSPPPTGRQSSSVFDEFGEKQAAPRIGGVSDIVSAMDGVFTVSGALRFLILQLVLVNNYTTQLKLFYKSKHSELLHPPVLECDEPAARQGPCPDRAKQGSPSSGGGGQLQLQPA